MTRWREVTRSPAWNLARRLVRRFQDSRLPLLGAALAYYAAFSLGPLLLLLAGWLGVVLENRPELANQYREVLTNLVAEVLPLQENSAELVTRSFETIVEQLSRGAAIRSALSVVVLLWASSAFFASLQQALEVIFAVSERRGFWRKRLVAVLLVLTVGLVIAVEIVGGLLFSALGQVGTYVSQQLEAINIALPRFPIGPDAGFWTQGLRLAIATLVFTLCFRYLPRRASRWSGALIGAAFSATGIVVMRWLLLLTFNLDRFNLIYGVITGLLLILLWLYLALLLFLIGALFAAEASALNERGGWGAQERTVQ